MSARQQWFQRLSLVATLLALCVVVLGAYVRLSDAGLGCPDWPGCYGHIGVPQDSAAVSAANEAYPERPVETDKGWKEMVHRYAAGLLGLVIAGGAVLGWRGRGEAGIPHRLALVILVLVIGQAILGMWTVTWKLKPLVVMAHLLGGLTILSLLWWQTLRSRPGPRALERIPVGRGTRLLLVLGLAAVVGQIALGGWTSANYAAVACNQFPACELGEYWPGDADFASGFELWHGIGPDYEYGTHLSHEAKVAIHLAHRAGAVAVTLLLGLVAWRLWRTTAGRLASRSALAVAGLLGVQLALGVGNVVLNLPLPVAVAHNAGAACLLLLFVTLNHLARPAPEPS